MTRSCDVAIVGGGIAGLTLARSLLQHSLSVLVFEQDPELREIGAGIALGGNATRLLARLGVELEADVNTPPTLVFRNWSEGSLLWEHRIGDWYRSTVGAPFLTLHRSTLQRALVAALPPKCIRLGHHLVGLSEAPDQVELQFEGLEEVVARIVVGADGVYSAVRRHVSGSVAPVHSGEIGIRGLIPIVRSPSLPDPKSLNIWCGPDTHVVYYGLEGGQINLLAVYKPRAMPAWTRDSSRRPATVDEALGILDGFGWDQRILDLVRRIEGEMSFWALLDLPPLERWSRGRAVVLGDAAHAPLPHQGQGAGMAIEDAYALGATLGDANLDAYEAVFEAFERRRKPRTRRIQAYSRLAGRAYKFNGDAAAHRNATLHSLPENIAWIHRHREEEAIVNVARTLEA